MGGTGRRERKEEEEGGRGRREREEGEEGGRGRRERKEEEGGGRGRRKRKEGEEGGRGRRENKVYVYKVTCVSVHLLCMASSRSWCLLVARIMIPSYCSICMWKIMNVRLVYILSPPLISSLFHGPTSVSITPRVGLGRVSRDSNNGSHSSKNSTALCILASRNRNRSSS